MVKRDSRRRKCGYSAMHTHNQPSKPVKAANQSLFPNIIME